MSDLKLMADPRTLTGRKVNQLRRQGVVPVVVYGALAEPVNLQVADRELELTLHVLAARRRSSRCR
jgi:ribosomal protein L25 (general stress protein Ctc)